MSECDKCETEYMSAIFPCNNCIFDPSLNDNFKPKEKRIPFLAIGKNQLTEEVEGDFASCSHCGGEHPLKYGKDENNKEDTLLQFFTCDKSGKSYLFSVAGKKLK